MWMVAIYWRSDQGFELCMFKKYSKNLSGRDFICSDIHGHFHLLTEAMESVGFNSEKDRIFSLGDLIDRGDDSTRVLEWIEKPWFFAIQGNHERMLITALEQQSQQLWFQWMMWGGDWAEDLDFETLTPYYEVLSRLPIAIEIELENNRSVGLVHAELPDTADWLLIKEQLECLDPSKVESTKECHDMLWRKNQPYLAPEIAERNIGTVANIDHVFHGHTIVDEFRTITNRTFMDLGSFHTGKLGFIEPRQFLAELKG